MSIVESDESTENDLPAELHGLSIEVVPSQAEKCVRCWHRSDDVGTNPDHPEACGRCVTNVTEAEGEKRLFA